MFSVNSSPRVHLATVSKQPPPDLRKELKPFRSTCANRLYICVQKRACVAHTACVIYPQPVSSVFTSPFFLLLRFGSELNSSTSVPDVKTSPSQVYISLVNLSVKADMSSSHNQTLLKSNRGDLLVKGEGGQYCYFDVNVCSFGTFRGE